MGSGVFPLSSSLSDLTVDPFLDSRFSLLSLLEDEEMGSRVHQFHPVFTIVAASFLCYRTHLTLSVSRPWDFRVSIPCGHSFA